LDPNDKKIPERDAFSKNKALFLAITLASYALLKKGNYKAALVLYPRAGGGGVNFYKKKLMASSTDYLLLITIQ
jgi:hypothetical protein